MTTYYVYVAGTGQYSRTIELEDSATPPSNSTDISPPDEKPEENQVYAFDGQKWSAQYNFIGRIYRMSDGVVDFQLTLGAMPQGFTPIKPPDFPLSPTVYVWNGRDWERGQDAINSQLAAQIRGQRNSLLQACDWTALPDVPISPASLLLFQQYRQALRDVPSQPGFPSDVVMPEIPYYEKQ